MTTLHKPTAATTDDSGNNVQTHDLTWYCDTHTAMMTIQTVPPIPEMIVTVREKRKTYAGVVSVTREAAQARTHTHTHTHLT
jgi:hypothetical protein